MFGRHFNSNDIDFYKKRAVVLGVCRYEDKYLLLRISKDWRFCPNDWDFVIGSFINPNLNSTINTILNVKKHTSLKPINLVKYPEFKWYDHESNILFLIHPFIVIVNNEKFELSYKFSEGKWVHRNSILEYDRNEYLFSVLNHLINF